jgi:hypothetical protein
MRSEARTSGLQDQRRMPGFVVSSRSTGSAGFSNSTSKSGISAASQSTFRPCASMISHEQGRFFGHPRPGKIQGAA